MSILFVLPMLVVVVTITYLRGRKERLPRKVSPAAGRPQTKSGRGFTIPVNDCFCSTHTWAGVQGQASAWVGIYVLAAVVRVLAGAIVLLPRSVPAQERVKAEGVPPGFNIQAQTACEAEMLRKMGAREVFSGKGYEVLTEVARAYGRAIPHMYIFPGSLNIGYIAASTAVDGRGKILAGRQAIELFDAFSLKGFLGHEVAHLVTDSAAQGCNDYIVRDPQMEADADGLAGRMLGKAAVEAFLRRVLALTGGQNWDAKRRLEILQSFQQSEEQWYDTAASAHPRRGIENPSTMFGHSR